MILYTYPPYPTRDKKSLSVSGGAVSKCLSPAHLKSWLAVGFFLASYKCDKIVMLVWYCCSTVNDLDSKVRLI